MDNKYKNIAIKYSDLLLKIISRIAYLCAKDIINDKELLEMVDDALMSLNIDHSIQDEYMIPYYKLLKK
jgi:hypothetical protein